MLKHQILDYASENHINTSDCETYGEIYTRILNNNSELHSREELQKCAESLLKILLKEYGFKATRVFAYHPLIATCEYHGFQEVYLYKHVHEAMGYRVKEFLLNNQIIEKLDKQVLEYEFKEIYDHEYGYIKLQDNVELLAYMQLLRRHGFDEKYCQLLEDDIKYNLILCGDKYFNKLDLTIKKNIVLLYTVCGELYGLPEYLFGVFQEYDGYGNVISSNNHDYIVNDFSYLLGED